MANIDDYINQPTEKTEVKSEANDNGELEIKQESLAILAALGTTKEYLGVEMSLGDIKKLSAKDVESILIVIKQ